MCIKYLRLRTRRIIQSESESQSQRSMFQLKDLGKESKFSFNLFFFFLLLFRAAPEVYGGSQARGQIGATAAGLHHSHSNARSKPSLRPTPQLTAAPDP